MPSGWLIVSLLLRFRQYRPGDLDRVPSTVDSTTHLSEYMSAGRATAYSWHPVNWRFRSGEPFELHANATREYLVERFQIADLVFSSRSAHRSNKDLAGAQVVTRFYSWNARACRLNAGLRRPHCSWHSSCAWAAVEQAGCR